MVKVKFSILILPSLHLLIVFLSNSVCEAQKKSCRISDLESKLKPMIGLFGLSDVRFAETEKEMDSWCRTLPSGSSSAKLFVKNCLNGFPKTVMSVTIFSADKWNIKSYCKNKVERLMFLSRAKCGNAGKKQTVKCWNRFINNMWNLKNVTKSNMKLPALCCNFFEWKSCTIETYRNIGAPVCKESDVLKFDEQITRGSLDPLNIFCNEYDESDKCDKIKDILPKTTGKQRSRDRTPFPAIFDVFQTL